MEIDKRQSLVNGINIADPIEICQMLKTQTNREVYSSFVSILQHLLVIPNTELGFVKIFCSPIISN